MTIGIAILALLIALYGAVADRLGRWSVTERAPGQLAELEEMPELYQRRQAHEGRVRA